MLAPHEISLYRYLVRGHCEAGRTTCSELVEPKQSTQDFITILRNEELSAMLPKHPKYSKSNVVFF